MYMVLSMDFLRNSVQAFLNLDRPERRGIPYTRPSVSTNIAIAREVGFRRHPQGGYLLSDQAIAEREVIIGQVYEFFHTLELPWGYVTVNYFQNVVANHNWYE